METNLALVLLLAPFVGFFATDASIIQFEFVCVKTNSEYSLMN